MKSLSPLWKTLNELQLQTGIKHGLKWPPKHLLALEWITRINNIQRLRTAFASYKQYLRFKPIYQAKGKKYQHICSSCKKTSTHDFISKELYCECNSQMVAKVVAVKQNLSIIKQVLLKMKVPAFHLAIEQIKDALTRISNLKKEKEQKYIDLFTSNNTLEAGLVCGKRKQKNTFVSVDAQTTTKYFTKKNVATLFGGEFTRFQFNNAIKPGFQYYSAVVYMKDEEGKEYINSTRYVAKQNLYGSFMELLKDLNENYKLDDIHHVIIKGMTKHLKGQLLSTVKGGQNIVSFNRKYEIFNPVSNLNCFYHCVVWFIAKLKNLEVDQTNIVNRADKLKRKMGNDSDIGAGQYDIQQVADYYGCNFLIFSPVFTRHLEIKCSTSLCRKDSVIKGLTLKLQFKQNHCLALKERDVPITEKEFFSVQHKTLKQLCYESKPIKPSYSKIICDCEDRPKGHKCENKKPERLEHEAQLWTYDIETVDTPVREILLEDCNQKLVKALKNVSFVDQYNISHTVDLEVLFNLPDRGLIKSIYLELEDRSITLLPIPYKNGLIVPHNQLLTLVECKVKRMQMAFALGVSKGPEKSDYITFYGLNCVQKFVDHLAQIQQPHPEIMLYAHNGGKFDLNVILKQLTAKLNINKDSYNEMNGCIINLAVKNDQEVLFTFRDSCRMVMGSLADICKSFKVKYQKKTEHQFKFWELDKFNIFQAQRQEIEEYLMYDCLSLYEIVSTLRARVWEENQIDIFYCLTAASLSKKHYFQSFYSKDYHRKNKPLAIYDLPKELDLEIRKSYLGGRCDIYYQGVFNGKYYYYDFTSLYPYVSTFDLPCGKPRYIEGEDISPSLNRFFGFVQCRVTTNREDLQLHGLKHDGKLIFGIHEDTSESKGMLLFSEEIKLGLSLGYKYEFLWGIQFQKDTLLKSFMTEGFIKKAEAKKRGDDVMAETNKIIINSGYGFWGYRWANKRSCISGNAQLLESMIQQEKVFNWNQLNDKDFIIDCQQDQDRVKQKNIAIASAITAYARMELFKLMHAVTQKGHKLIYSDTDSIITDCDLSKDPELQQQFMWDFDIKNSQMPDIWCGAGSDLGSIKNECLAKLQKKKLSAQDISQQEKRDGGDLCFDQVIALMPKGYGLKKQLIDNSTLDVKKMKGLCDLTYDQLQTIAFGGKISQTQDQFISGKGAHVDENSMFVQMRTTTKTVSLKYDKGYVRATDGKVLPKLFINGIDQGDAHTKVSEGTVKFAHELTLKDWDEIEQALDYPQTDSDSEQSSDDDY